MTRLTVSDSVVHNSFSSEIIPRRRLLLPLFQSLSRETGYFNPPNISSLHPFVLNLPSFLQ